MFVPHKTAHNYKKISLIVSCERGLYNALPHILSFKRYESYRISILAFYAFIFKLEPKPLAFFKGARIALQQKITNFLSQIERRIFCGVSFYE